GTNAWESSVVGLIGGIKAERLGQDPKALYPTRNKTWVGLTGEGSGRVFAPSAVYAITKGVTAYTPATATAPRQLQPSWSLDDLAAGESATQQFLLHGAPGLAGRANTTFQVATGREASGVHAAPASWFRVPSRVSTTRNADAPFDLRLTVPAGTAPGLYTATIVGTATTADGTQQFRIPVQFYATLASNSVSGPIWASE